MPTLSSLIGTPLHEMPEMDRLTFIEQLRDLRQRFSENAYEQRQSRRKAAKVPAPKLESLIDEDFDL